MPDIPPLGSGLALACGLIAMGRRKRAIGGWLFYFFCQVFIGLALLATSTHWKYYLPQQWGDPLHYFLFTLSSLSRLALLACIAVVSVLLFETRSAAWIAALQYALATYAFVTVLKIPVDLFCFPSATSRDTMSLGFPLVWMVYFAVSVRVRQVFVEKSWPKSVDSAHGIS
jgi:hypothetical protein